MEHSPSTSPIEEDGKQRSMMAAAISYNNYLKYPAPEGSDSLWMDNYTAGGDDDDDEFEDHFQAYDPKSKGHLVFGE